PLALTGLGPAPGSGRDARGAGRRSLVGDAGDLPRSDLDAPAEVERPLLPERRRALAARVGAAAALRHAPWCVGQTVEGQNGPELPADAHLHRLQAELGVVRV